MTEEKSLRNNGKTDKDKPLHPCPDCANIISKFLIAIIIFGILALSSNILFDIRGYIEDHGLEFQYIEFSMILSLLIVFYLISKKLMDFLLYLYNRIFSLNKCDNNGYIQLIGSIILSLIYIYFASNYFTSILAPHGGIQEDMLRNTIFWWLVTILAVNVLINSSRFQEKSIHFISSKFCRALGMILRNPLNKQSGEVKND
jgi:hypothetical protein